eukprot:8103676-Heterocapsa_arctica.AAC.1
MPELWPRRKLAPQDTLSKAQRAPSDSGKGTTYIWSGRKGERHEGTATGISSGPGDVCIRKRENAG